MMNTNEHGPDRPEPPKNIWAQPKSDYFGGTPSVERDPPALKPPEPIAPGREPRRSPPPAEKRHVKQGSGRARRLIWLPLGGMLIVIVTLAWCLIFCFLGNRAYENGEYEKAASLFRKDPLLSRTMLWNAEYQNATEKYRQGQFAQAAELYAQLGEDAHDGWLSAVTAEAERLQRESSLEAGLEYLAPYAGEERIDRAMSSLQTRLAKELLGTGQAEEALAVAAEIKYPDEAELDTFYEKAYYLLGTEALADADYALAAECLLQCEDASARAYGAILSDILSGAYYEAAQKIVALEDRELDSYLTEPLSSILTDRFEDPRTQDLDARLVQEAAEKLLDSIRDTGGFSAERFSDDGDFFFFEGAKLIQDIQAETDLIPVASLDELLEKTATAPAGKVLVIREQYGYPKAEPQYAVELQVMSRLPVELYPVDLAQVEYLITLAYDYSKTGERVLAKNSFLGADWELVDVLRLKGRVRAVALPSGQELYCSPLVQGGSSAYALGGGDGWICGDPPRIQKHIYTAITKLLP